MKSTIYKWGRYYLQYSPVWRQVSKIYKNKTKQYFPDILAAFKQQNLNIKNAHSKDQVQNYNYPSCLKDQESSLLKVIALNRRLRLSHRLLFEQNLSKSFNHHSGQYINCYGQKLDFLPSLHIKKDSRSQNMRGSQHSLYLKKEQATFQQFQNKISNLIDSHLFMAADRNMRNNGQGLSKDLQAQSLNDITVAKLMALISHNLISPDYSKDMSSKQNIYEVSQLKKRILIKQVLKRLNRCRKKLQELKEEQNRNPLQNVPQKNNMLALVDQTFLVLSLSLKVIRAPFAKTQLQTSHQANISTMTAQIDEEQINDWLNVLFVENDILWLTCQSFTLCVSLINKLQIAHSYQISTFFNLFGGISKVGGFLDDFVYSIISLCKLFQQKPKIGQKIFNLCLQKSSNFNQYAFQNGKNIQISKQVRLQIESCIQKYYFNVFSNDNHQNSIFLAQIREVSSIEKIITNYKQNFLSRIPNPQQFSNIKRQLQRLIQFKRQTNENRISKNIENATSFINKSIRRQFYLWELSNLMRGFSLIQTIHSNNQLVKLLQNQSLQEDISQISSFLVNCITKQVTDTVNLLYTLIKQEMTTNKRQQSAHKQKRMAQYVKQSPPAYQISRMICLSIIVQILKRYSLPSLANVLTRLQEHCNLKLLNYKFQLARYSSNNFNKVNKVKQQRPLNLQQNFSFEPFAEFPDRLIAKKKVIKIQGEQNQIKKNINTQSPRGNIKLPGGNIKAPSEQSPFQRQIQVLSDTMSVLNLLGINKDSTCQQSKMNEIRFPHVMNCIKQLIRSLEYQLITQRKHLILENKQKERLLQDISDIKTMIKLFS